MTVCGFISMFEDSESQEFSVYSNSEGKEIFRGHLKEYLDTLMDEDIVSINNLLGYGCCICINVE